MSSVMRKMDIIADPIGFQEDHPDLANEFGDILNKKTPPEGRSDSREERVTSPASSS